MQNFQAKSGILRRIFKTIDSYIFTEFFLPFLSSLGIIAGVWLGIDRFKQIFKLLASEEYPWYTAFLVLALDIPKILLNILPICILLACFLSFQKLSLQAEFTAMRSAGASYLRILRPVLVFGLFGALSCFCLSEILLPLSIPVGDSLVRKHDNKEIKGFTFTKHRPDANVQQIFYAKSIKEGELTNLVIVNFSKEDLINIYIAKTAHWNQPKHGWDLEKGNTSFIDRGNMSDGEDFNHLVSNFKTKFLHSKSNPLDLLHVYKRAHTLNVVELLRIIAWHDFNKIETSSLNSLKTNFQQRFAYPVTAVILAFIGALLGFSSRRESRNWNYILLGLIVFSFFMLQAIFTSFGDSGRIPAFLAMWAPNLLLALINIIIFYIKAR